MSQNDPVAIIIRTLMSQALCASCITAVTGLSDDVALDALARMTRVRAIIELDERCPACHNPGPVYRIAEGSR